MPEVIGTLIPPRQSNAPTSPVVGQLYTDTDDNTLYWWNGSAWVSAGGGGTTEVYTGPNAPSPRGTNVIWIDTDEQPATYWPPPLLNSLPSSPVDGQEAYLSAAGMLWHLRFTKAWFDVDGQGWCFLGGMPLYASTETAETTASTTYVDLTTVGPSVTLPNGIYGVFDVEVGALMTTAAAAASGCVMSFALSGIADAGDAYAAVLTTNSTTAQGASVHRKGRYTQSTMVGTALTFRGRYRANNANTVTFNRRWITVTPVRVAQA